MKNTDRELLEIPYQQNPKELFSHIGRLLARLDTLKYNREENRSRYFDGFKTSKEGVSTFEEFDLRIIDGLSKLLTMSYNTNFFWYDCPLQVYENTFYNRLEELKKDDPELTENGLKMQDYQILDNFPLFRQRFLRIDNEHTSIDYGQILDKRKEDNVNSILLQKARDLKYKLERARDEKMKFIQEHFLSQGQMILKNGYEFELKNIPTPPAKIVEVAPPHSDIFTNNGFKLFDYLIKNSITENRGRKDDIAYFYRRMFDDKFLIARPVPFIAWFLLNYNEELGDKLKALYQVDNTIRKKEYSRALEWLKAQ